MHGVVVLGLVGLPLLLRGAGQLTLQLPAPRSLSGLTGLKVISDLYINFDFFVRPDASAARATLLSCLHQA